MPTSCTHFCLSIVLGASLFLLCNVSTMIDNKMCVIRHMKWNAAFGSRHICVYIYVVRHSKIQATHTGYWSNVYINTNKYHTSYVYIVYFTDILSCRTIFLIFNCKNKMPVSSNWFLTCLCTLYSTCMQLKLKLTVVVGTSYGAWKLSFLPSSHTIIIIIVVDTKGWITSRCQVYDSAVWAVHLSRNKE